ncbi:ChaN family lipoprotein [Metapseudomonas boanensis]|uniref:ChaN family lipoprotein n=1 Tax=Metapseudomonas boanensis TaxID=2822138 RepID=A0ABS5XP39_9GAMM|nr:ChaN family lipoprotein [Pseudomonas boanensis]MBT8769464.1 ChaN family lipoprotein [Pseudomonas boanensis]
MRFLLICWIGLLAACQSLPPLPAWQSPEGRDRLDLGVIRDLRSGDQLTPRQLVGRLAGSSRVLVGEQHDNPDHHALQLWLLQAMEARRAQGSLLLEMLDPDQQVLVDSAHKASAAGQASANLPQALAWQKNWEWTFYGPIVRHALEQPYPLLAANLDRSEIKLIYQTRPTLQGQASTAEAVRGPLLEQIRESHCGLLPESQMPAMLAVQQQRDRRMAEQLLAAPQPAMLFAGAFHVRRDLGVPLHLTDLGSGEGNAVLILSEVGKPVDAGAADYVWYTAALPPVDHCAGIRERLPAAR